MIKALIFDFDGLILDTESPEAETWTHIYQEHGYVFPFDDWVQTVGGYGISTFDAAEHLAHLSQGQLDPDSIRTRHRFDSRSIVDYKPLMPGVLDYIHDAKRMGLKIAIASSSSHAWVDTHAKRLGIFHYFDRIICSDDVGNGRTKPYPDLFLLALDQLRVWKDEAIVLEDSPNGVTAANRAGIFVVNVPNSITSRLNIQGAQMRLNSLAEVSLEILLGRISE